MPSLVRRRSSICADLLHPPVRKRVEAGRCDRQTDEESETLLKLQASHLPALVTQPALNQFQELTDEQQEGLCGGRLKLYPASYVNDLAAAGYRATRDYLKTGAVTASKTAAAWMAADWYFPTGKSN